MGSGRSLPQQPENDSGQASVVISTLIDDPNGQVRAPTEREQTVCDADSWRQICRLASGAHTLGGAAATGTVPPSSMRPATDALLAELSSKYPELRFKIRTFWVDFFTTSPHWEYVLHVFNPHGPFISQPEEADVPPKWQQKAVSARPLPPLPDPRRPVPYQDFWLQRGILRHQPLEPLPEKLKRNPVGSQCYLEATVEIQGGTRRKSPSWLPEEWDTARPVAPTQGHSTRPRTSQPSVWCCSQGLQGALHACHQRTGLGAVSSKDLASADPLVRPLPRRWYRLHPGSDLKYYVRPDAGLRGRMPGFASNTRANAVSHYASPASAKEADSFRQELEKKGDVQGVQSKWKGGVGGRKKIQHSWSVPNFVERQWMLETPTGFECDAFRNCCRICYEQPAELIALPCRHGGLCVECLRRTFLSRPKHRGGHNCPFCRKRVTEVIQTYRDSYGPPQYAFAIQFL